MNETLQTSFTNELSAEAQQRILSRRGEPALLCAWDDALMLHFEVDAEALQHDVPFELDLRDGRAFASLVAFTMREMRPRVGGRLAALLFRPIATHEFLNVRTYVRHSGENGIHFIAEWLTNRLAVMLGPKTFGLPYRHGRIVYQHDWENGIVSGQVTDAKDGARLEYYAKLTEPLPFQPCATGSLDEWLMERYTAFNSTGSRKKFFRVWHPPWPQCAADVVFKDQSLLTKNWPWFRDAKFVGANFSPGFDVVWLGRPWPVTSGKPNKN
jgi:uncharacterized protein YqjF (DUF2071 family)